jgi:hypothetical protein
MALLRRRRAPEMPGTTNGGETVLRHHLSKKIARTVVSGLALVTFGSLLVGASPGAAYADVSCVGGGETGYVCVPPRFVGISPAPETVDANAISVPNASDVLAKEQQTSDYELQSAALLSLNFTSPVPDDTTIGATSGIATPCVDPGDCGSSAAPSSYGLSIQGKQQQNHVWCVPATAQMILATMGASTPSQATLASEMHTGSQGTYLRYVPNSLNRRQSRNPYQVITVSSAQNLMSRAITDIYRYKSTYLLGIDVSTIGYYPAGWTGSHAINNYAYYTQSGGGLYVFDPMNPAYTGGQSYYGKHNVKLATAYSSIRTDGGELVW